MSWRQEARSYAVYILTIVVGMLLALSTLAAPPCQADGHNQRRSEAAKREFMRTHPCPGGPDRGSTRRCRGYIIDHRCALACCGLDAPINMQWQTVAASRAKDRVELSCPRVDCRPPRVKRRP